MTHEDEIRAHRDAYPHAPVMPFDVDYLLAEVERLRDQLRDMTVRADERRIMCDERDALVTKWHDRAEQAEAKVARVEALAAEWTARSTPGEWSSALNPRAAADAIRNALEGQGND